MSKVDVHLELRAQILRTIQQAPGHTGKELAAQFEVDEKVCYGQLKRLKKERKIRTEVGTNTRGQGFQYRYFLKG